MNFLPTIPSNYYVPGTSAADKTRRSAEKQRQLDLALDFLASLDLSAKRAPTRAYVSQSAVANLCSYLCFHRWEVIQRAFCCCIATQEADRQRPIPENAYRTLALTREQFDRNTLGVCCIAPAVVIATPFIPAGKIVATLLGIFSGLVILTTAGTNTYVFSGDIGVVPNGRGDLCVEGGIRVDAIQEIARAYCEMAAWLREKWAKAKPHERGEIQGMCLKIQERWEFIVDEMSSCGLRREAVETILTDFAQVIDEITTAASLSQNSESPWFRGAQTHA